MPCSVCGAASSYKCPNCRIPYCSVKCCTVHKQTCQSTLQSTQSTEDGELPKKENKKGESDDDDDGSESVLNLRQLEALGQSNELKEKLGNPHLRELLLKIEQVEKVASKQVLLDNLMNVPIFKEFTEHCLQISDGHQDGTN